LAHQIVDLLGRPLREIDRAVLLGLGGLVALDADPRVVPEPDLVAGLVVINGFVRLVDGAAAAELALALLDRLQIRVGADRVAHLERSLPLEERARPDGVHARQAFGQPAVTDGTEGVEGLDHDVRREEPAPLRALRVRLVVVERRRVADAERHVVGGVLRHLGAPRAAPLEALADARPDAGDAFVGYARAVPFDL